MTEHSVLKWLDEPGWLILSGGVDPLSDLRAQAISRIVSEGGIAYIALDDDDLDDLIDDMGELGAPTGFIINVMTEDDQTIRAMLEHAAMVFLPGIYDLTDLHSSLLGAAIEGILAAYQDGAVIFAEGQAVSLFGSSFRSAEGVLLQGFGWVEDTLILPGVSSIAESNTAQIALAEQQARIVIGLEEESALVLGPQGHIERWGDGNITVALGEDRYRE